MTHGSILVMFYSSRVGEESIDVVLDVCNEVGFDTEKVKRPFDGSRSDELSGFDIPYDDWTVSVRFRTDTDRSPTKPAVSLISLNHLFVPSQAPSDKAHRQRMNVMFELLCKLAIALEAEYVAVCNTEGRPNAITPTDRPIAKHVDTPPRIGIYTPEVLDTFGEVTGLFDTEPWYVAELTDGRILVIESPTPWNESGWEPPTSAGFIDYAEFHTRDDVSGPSEHRQADTPEEFDPFAALEVGEYGADVGVHPDDIAPEFRNEDLRLVRVYRDDQGNLRRVEDDAFVRNVVVDSENNEELVRGMLANVPADARDSDLLLSALIHEAIPPSFVRLDDPDGENVVTKVMALEVETNKYELLLSLGDAVQHADTGGEVAKVEQALDNLADFEGVEGIERYIEQNLL